MGYVTVLLLAFVLLSCGAYAFPDGAPVDACVKPRPNEPYHGQARTQPLETNPYLLLASTSHYQPGSQVTGNAAINKVHRFILYTSFLIHCKPKKCYTDGKYKQKTNVFSSIFTLFFTLRIE